MANKSHELLNGWTLIADRSFKLFSNNNAYILIDNENDILLQFILEEQEFEVLQSSWSLKYKIIPTFKTIKILTVPDEE